MIFKGLYSPLKAYIFLEKNVITIQYFWAEKLRNFS